MKANDHRVSRDGNRRVDTVDAPDMPAVETGAIQEEEFRWDDWLFCFSLS